MDEGGNRRWHATSWGSSRQEARWGLIARAGEPGVGQLRDYVLMTVEGR